jgi:hypothetical protein
MTATAHRFLWIAALATMLAFCAVPSAFANATPPGTCPCNVGLPLVQHTAAPPSTAVRILPPTDSAGFSWSAFGIGAAATAGTIIALTGLGIGFRHARRPLRSA